MARPTLTWALLLAALVPLAAAESRSLKFKPYASTPGGCRKKEGLHDIYWNMMAADRDEFAKFTVILVSKMDTTLASDAKSLVQTEIIESMTNPDAMSGSDFKCIKKNVLDVFCAKASANLALSKLNDLIDKMEAPSTGTPVDVAIKALMEDYKDLYKKVAKKIVDGVSSRAFLINIGKAVLGACDFDESELD